MAPKRKKNTVQFHDSDDFDFSSDCEAGYQDQHDQFYKTDAGLSATTTTVYVPPTPVKKAKASPPDFVEPVEPLIFGDTDIWNEPPLATAEAKL
jgi:hypothetical protein